MLLGTTSRTLRCRHLSLWFSLRRALAAEELFLGSSYSLLIKGRREVTQDQIKLIIRDSCVGVVVDFLSLVVKEGDKRIDSDVEFFG